MNGKNRNECDMGIHSDYFINHNLEYSKGGLMNLEELIKQISELGIEDLRKLAERNLSQGWLV